jgi:hypothetical protein
MAGRKQPSQDEEQSQPKKVYRKYPANSPEIKRLEVVFGATLIQKNSANQKSRQYKEKIHSGPAQRKNFAGDNIRPTVL